METSRPIDLIRDSFELWYNAHTKPSTPVSIAINYSDTQQLSIKAIHTVTIDVYVINIQNGMSVTTRLLSVKENYNHGETTEQKAESMILKKLLVKLYQYNR